MGERKLTAASLKKLLEPWSGRGAAYQHLARALRQSILGGLVPLTARLPAERDLATALGISRTTVSAAYTVLRDEGFVLSRRGAHSVTALPVGNPVPLPLPYELESAILLDLAYATLPAPAGVMHRAYEGALTALTAYLPTHGYALLGLPVLREAIAERYAKRGLPTAPEQIIVTFGAQHAFSLLIRALTTPGERVLVDQPTYLHALDALRQASCRLVPVALTDEGWDMDALRATLRQTAPRLAYLIPDFHNPTGRCMPEHQRAEVAEAAFENRTVVVIDETLVDLALDVGVPLPFALYARPDQIVSVGSLSKSFWSGLRIGWIRAPKDLIPRIAAARIAVDLGTPILEQLVGVALLADAESTLALRRDVLRRQRAVLTAALSTYLPDWCYHPPEGGLSLWVTLPAPVGSALAATSERFGVRVAAGSRFGAEGLLEHHLRIPFTLPEHDLSEAIRRLAQAYAALTIWGGNSVLERAEATVV